MLARPSLRARLLLGVIAIAFAGLVTADVATYASLKSFLIDRVDSTLDSVHGGVQTVFFRPGEDGGDHGPGPGNAQAVFNQIPGYCLQLRHLDETAITREICIPHFGKSQPEPGAELPATVELPSTPNAQGDRITYFTVPAAGGGSSYRVRASAEARDPSRILLIAAPLSDVNSTLHRLLLIELGVTIAVLSTMILLGLWIIRLGLRPLERMGRTADAIAAGDLSRRVEPAEQRTEVGRLGLALNSMLHSIEEAATARDASLRALEASESKLRRFVADAARRRARLRRAVPAGRRRPARRPRTLDEGDQPRVGAHERARRGPAAPGPPRRGAAARARAGRARRRRRRGTRDCAHAGARA